MELPIKGGASISRSGNPDRRPFLRDQRRCGQGTLGRVSGRAPPAGFSPVVPAASFCRVLASYPEEEVYLRYCLQTPAGCRSRFPPLPLCGFSVSLALAMLSAIFPSPPDRPKPRKLGEAEYHGRGILRGDHHSCSVEKQSISISRLFSCAFLHFFSCLSSARNVAPTRKTDNCMNRID